VKSTTIICKGGGSVEIGSLTSTADCLVDTDEQSRVTLREGGTWRGLRLAPGRLAEPIEQDRNELGVDCGNGLTAYLVNGHWVIADKGSWLPGNYDSKKTAVEAAALDDKTLLELQDSICATGTGEGRSITHADIEQAKA
jgi:hypothetical protein